MNKIYVQYGCGFCAPSGWRNFDASPTLRLERLPIIGALINKNENPFPEKVEYGNIVNGLSIQKNSCDGIYASHVLEHLALNELRLALQNSFEILKPNGIFRLVVPDLKIAAQRYVESNTPTAVHEFFNATSLGVKVRPKGFYGLLKSYLGNSMHLWMWDFEAFSKELEEIGFKNIRACLFDDCKDPAFKAVEDEARFIDAVAIECSK